MEKISCHECYFRKLAANYLTEEEIKLLCRAEAHVTYAKGETILRQGDPSLQLVILQKGVVKFNYRNEGGRNFIMTIVSGPKILGGANLFYNETNIFSMIAMAPSDICLINSSVFSQAMISNPVFFAFLIRNAMEMFQASVFNFISIAHKQVPGRIADVLIYLWEHVFKHAGIPFVISRKEIAEFASCAHENAISTMSKFRKEGIIDIVTNEIKILNLDKLKEISAKG